VQQAIHVKGNVSWSDCSNAVGNAYNGDDVNADVQPVYHALLSQTKQPIDIMIYSGDDDSICATEGTQQFIWNMGFPVAKPWTAWDLGDQQTAGYTTLFTVPSGSFRFSTVHGRSRRTHRGCRHHCHHHILTMPSHRLHTGAGHMVPSTRPAQGLEALRKYLNQDW
jgi:hypothetical protein